MKKKKSPYRQRVEERDRALRKLEKLQRAVWALQNWIEPQGIDPFDVLEGNEEMPSLESLEIYQRNKKHKCLSIETLKKEILAIKVFE